MINTHSFRLLAVLLLLPALLPAQDADDTYRFIADLRETKKDKLPVILFAPKIEQAEITYWMPEIVPGIYGRMNFGAYVSDFQASDSSGNLLEVVRKGHNAWRIKDATRLYQLMYKVDDTWDSPEISTPARFKSAGSSFNKDSVWVINHNALFGYFEGLPAMPYDVLFLKPSGFYGATAMTPLERSQQEERYRMPDYRRLVDAPILFSRPDTATVRVANTEVLVSIYSSSGKKYAKRTARVLDTLLQAQKEYLGGELPVQRYAFLICHYKWNDPNSMTGDALEHSNSSLYFFQTKDFGGLPQFVRDIAAHEFFHIVTPLNIHSQEIENYNFNNPVLSKHLWLYEGMTEYATLHMQGRQKLLDKDRFLAQWQEKIRQMMRFRQDLSLTELSQKAIDQYSDQYMNVYQKGALIGLCLDLRLRELSEGAYGTQDLLRGLMQRYGPERPFKDEELFDVIAAMTYPEIRQFFADYVEGAKALPLAQTFESVGIIYNPKHLTLEWEPNPTPQQLERRRWWGVSDEMLRR